MRNKNTISRRNFIKTVAATTVGVSLMGLNNEVKAETLTQPVKWDMEAEFVVAGGGAAGCMGALEAAERGIKVLLLESTSMLGGSSALSSGWIRSHSTKWHDARKIKDSAEAYAAEGLQYGSGTRDPKKMQIIAELVPDFVNRLIDLGVPFTDDEDKVNGGETLRQTKPLGGGATNMKFLSSAVYKNKNITVKTDSKILGIYKTTAPDVLIGIIADIEGKKVNIKTNAVLIATGGYSRDYKFVEKYAYEFKDATRLTGLGLKGEGLRIASANGAGVANINVPMVMANLEYTKKLYYSSATYAAGSILVNKNGERFVNELLLYGGASRELLKQPEQKAYQVVCGGLHALVDKMINDGVTVKGDTIEELAKNLGVNANNLKFEIEEHNKHTASGTPDRFGRAKFDKQLKAPFYAIRSWPVMIETAGGFLINEKSEVVDFDNKPVVKGLYGAGAAAFGEHFGMGYRSGDAMAYAGTTGMQAGIQASKLLKA